MTRKILAAIVCLSIFVQQAGFCQSAVELNIAARLGQPAAAGARPNAFRPLHLRYLSYDSLNNTFDLLVDKGERAPAYSASELNSRTHELLRYFFIGISLPADTFWVNLRPDSPDTIIDPALEDTDIGRVLLEADLALKKDTARLTSPELPEGKAYWERLYKKAYELYGTEPASIPTVTRPWIVPDEIIIRQASGNAYIYKATLKVLLEEDYIRAYGAGVAGAQEYRFNDERARALNEYSTQLIRELILPKLTREVNTGRAYAALRQVYYSLILAQWFKDHFRSAQGLYASLIERKNLVGLHSAAGWSKDSYFQAYRRSFTEGEYCLKEPVYTPSGQMIRTYTSGGMNLGGLPDAVSAGVIQNERNDGDFLIPAYGVAGMVTGGTVREPFSITVEVDAASSEGSTASSGLSSIIDRLKGLFGKEKIDPKQEAAQRRLERQQKRQEEKQRQYAEERRNAAVAIMGNLMDRIEELVNRHAVFVTENPGDQSLQRQQHEYSSALQGLRQEFGATDWSEHARELFEAKAKELEKNIDDTIKARVLAEVNGEVVIIEKMVRDYERLTNRRGEQAAFLKMYLLICTQVQSRAAQMTSSDMDCLLLQIRLESARIEHEVRNTIQIQQARLKKALVKEVATLHAESERLIDAEHLLDGERAEEVEDLIERLLVVDEALSEVKSRLEGNAITAGDPQTNAAAIDVFLEIRQSFIGIQLRAESLVNEAGELISTEEGRVLPVEEEVGETADEIEPDEISVSSQSEANRKMVTRELMGQIQLLDNLMYAMTARGRIGNASMRRQENTLNITHAEFSNIIRDDSFLSDQMLNNNAEAELYVKGRKYDLGFRMTDAEVVLQADTPLPTDLREAILTVTPDTSLLKMQLDTLRSVLEEIEANGQTDVPPLNYLLGLEAQPDAAQTAEIPVVRLDPQAELDLHQHAAVEMALRNSMSVVLGYWAGGKTKVATELIRELVEEHNEPVIFLAQQHKNVDDLVRKVGETVPTLRFFSRAREDRVAEDVRVRYRWNSQGAVSRFEKQLQSRRGFLLAATLMGGSVHSVLQDVVAQLNGFEGEASQGKGPTVVIDEATLINFPELIFALYTFKPSRLVLIGDTHQFAPFPLQASLSARQYAVLKSQLGKGLERFMKRYDRSLFEDYVSMANGSGTVTKLLKNYRNHWLFDKFIRFIFAGIDIRESVSLQRSDPVFDDTLIIEDTSAGTPQAIARTEEQLVSYTKENGRDNRSWVNEGEAQRVVSWIIKMLSSRDREGQRVTPRDIMVVSPYDAQVQRIQELVNDYEGPVRAFIEQDSELRELIRQQMAVEFENEVRRKFAVRMAYASVEEQSRADELISEEVDRRLSYESELDHAVNTLKAGVMTSRVAQGLENKVVMVSLVRCRTDGKAADGRNVRNNSYAIVSNKRLLLVSLTRSREKLVVIGDKETLSGYSDMYKNLFNFANGDRSNGSQEERHSATVRSSSSLSSDRFGGIDLRRVSARQSAGAVERQRITLVHGRLSAEEFQREWRQIVALAGSGVEPSCARILEAVLSLDDPDDQTETVIAGIADLLRIEEEQGIATGDGLRQLVVLLESGAPVQEIEVSFKDAGAGE